MGEAKRNAEAQGERETFTPGVVTLTDNQTGRLVPLFIERDGKVYRLRVSARVRESEMIDTAHDAARQAGMSSSRIIRSGGLVVPGRTQ